MNYRIITEKDREGLVEAVRVYARTFLDERLMASTTRPHIDKAVNNGISVDVLLNPAIWRNYVEGYVPETMPKPSMAGYVEYLILNKNNPGVCRLLKNEPDWFEKDFNVVNEAVHDFFLAVTEKGGKWNLDSARRNLAKIIEKHSLQAILSEELIKKVEESESKALNSFTYLDALAKDFNSLPVNNNPTIEELGPASESAQAEIDMPPVPEAPTEEEESNEEPEPEYMENGDPDEQPEDEVYNMEPVQDRYTPSGLESTVLLGPDPKETKKECIRIVLRNFTPTELLGLVKTIDNGMNLSIDEIIDKLTNGQFDVKKEDTETQEVHRMINSDLTMSFIDCINIQGEEMNEDLAADYDILHDSWDLRAAEVKKYHKLLRLIYTEGKDDPDLLDAVTDIEKLYLNR